MLFYRWVSGQKVITVQCQVGFYQNHASHSSETWCCIITPWHFKAMWCPVLKDETGKLYKLSSAEIIPRPSEITHQNAQINMEKPSLLDIDIHKTAHEKHPCQHLSEHQLTSMLQHVHRPIATSHQLSLGWYGFFQNHIHWFFYF